MRIMSGSHAIATIDSTVYSLFSMTIKRVTPDEAAKLMEQGWKYIDVRSIPEFEQGHARGAYNVPISHKSAHGMVPNQDFISVMNKCFASDDGLVVACRTSGRAARAAQALNANGFSKVIIMGGGFGGEPGCEGWPARNLPVATAAAEPGHSYAELSTQ
jgi:rhodanese-related sulfurtransferase